MQSWKKNPLVNEAWQNDKNGCNRHRCKESGYWLSCSVLEPKDFSCRPCCKPMWESQCLQALSYPIRSSCEGLLWSWDTDSQAVGRGVSTTLRIKGTLLSLLDPTKAHVSDTLQVLISALEWTGRICDLIGWGLGSSREGVSTSLTPLQAWPILAFRLNLSHQINKAIVRS